MIDIRSFMDIEELQKLQDMFSEATGLAAITVGADGKYITKGSGFTDFCMKYTRKSPEGAKRCLKCDTECKGTYFCHAGLMDFASDIMIGDEKVGSIIGGQVLSEEPDAEKFRNIAAELGINPESYLDAVSRVPIRDEKAIRSAADLLGFVVNQFVNFKYVLKLNKDKDNTLKDQLPKLDESVDGINDTINSLKKIASYEHILALNASIEAARCGSAGKGFAVVAEEMGKFAGNAENLYKKIEEFSNSSQDSIREINKITG